MWPRPAFPPPSPLSSIDETKTEYDEEDVEIGIEDEDDEEEDVIYEYDDGKWSAPRVIPHRIFQ